MSSTGQHLPPLEQLRKAAELGDPKAQDDLGLRYSRGEEIPQDHKQAVRWYRLSAEQGFHWAQYHLGYAYEIGHGVQPKPQSGITWLLSKATSKP